MESENHRLVRMAIDEAIGEASLCWDPKPSTEIFDSSHARAVADGLMAKLKEIFGEF